MRPMSSVLSAASGITSSREETMLRRYTYLCAVPDAEGVGWPRYTSISKAPELMTSPFTQLVSKGRHYRQVSQTGLSLNIERLNFAPRCEHGEPGPHLYAPRLRRPCRQTD